MGQFKSRFQDDLENMILLKTATNFCVSTYLERAKTFESFCEKQFPDCGLLSEQVVLSWVKDALDCRTRNVAHARISFCRTLGEYQKAIGKTPFIPAENMLSGKSMFVPYIFADEELTALFEVIDAYKKRSNPFEGVLLSVYFRLCYTCGLRPHECRVLKRIDVDLNSGELRIINTKWNQSRTIIMSDEVCELVRKYAIQRDIKFPESEYLFPVRDGGAYSATQIQNRFRKFYELFRRMFPKNFCLQLEFTIYVIQTIIKSKLFLSMQFMRWDSLRKRFGFYFSLWYALQKIQRRICHGSITFIGTP